MHTVYTAAAVCCAGRAGKIAKVKKGGTTPFLFFGQNVGSLVAGGGQTWYDKGTTKIKEI